MIIRPNAGFIIPTRRFVDVGMPRGRVTAKGRYKLHKVKNGVRTGEETPWFDNLILDSGLNRWGTGAIIAGAAIGTGSSAPDVAQTGLETEVHYTTTTGTGGGISALGSSPYNNTRTVVYRTTLGALSGNYSEVGVGWASGSMFSRALILDGGGSPTTISVAVDEQLDIVYQLSVFPPLTDFADTVSISGVSYDVTGRASNVNAVSGTGPWAITVTGAITLLSNTSTSYAWSGAIGAITTTPSGTPVNGGTATTDSYVNNSMQRTATETDSLTQANASGGIMSTRASWGTHCAFQYQFDPVIPKDGTKTLALNYSFSWARRP